MSNPFTNLGAPPEGDDPEGQLRYLRQVMDAFSQTDNPRVKPLGRKLDVALEKMAKKSERGADPETLARELHAEVRALSLQTYELLLTVINQVRATLRIKLQRGMAGDERLKSEQLQDGLALYAQGLRKLLSAIKKGNQQGQDEGSEMLQRASLQLDAIGQQLRT